MIESRRSCGGYGSAGEQPERRHEAEDWAGRATLCPMLSAQSLAQGDKLSGQRILVCAFSSSGLDGLAIEMAAILTPGRVSGWRPGGFELLIDGFAIGDVGLAGRLVVDSIV